jgi:hypothetical protein
MNKVDEFIQHISTTPWSNYTEADYNLDQWHKACLIHQHTGPPTSKTQCKLPVRTPDGVLNRNGVFAAAAAMAGARGGVNATPDELAKAKTAIAGFYRQLNAKLPASIAQTLIVDGEDFLQHYGKLGMKWGRRSGGGGGSTSQPSRPHKPRAQDLTDEQLRKAIGRMQMEQQYSGLSKQSKITSKGAKFVAGMGKDIVKMAIMAVATQQVHRAIKKHGSTKISKLPAQIHGKFIPAPGYL